MIFKSLQYVTLENAEFSNNTDVRIFTKHLYVGAHEITAKTGGKLRVEAEEIILHAGFKLNVEDGSSIIGLKAKGPGIIARSSSQFNKPNLSRDSKAMKKHYPNFKNFELFPNPATDFIQIKSTNPLDAFGPLREIQIHDLNGVLLFHNDDLNHHEYKLDLNQIKSFSKYMNIIISCKDGRGEIQRKLITIIK